MKSYRAGTRKMFFWHGLFTMDKTVQKLIIAAFFYLSRLYGKILLSLSAFGC